MHTGQYAAGKLSLIVFLWIEAAPPDYRANQRMNSGVRDESEGASSTHPFDVAARANCCGEERARVKCE